MNQQVEDALGGFDAAIVPVGAINTPAFAANLLSKAEIAMLLRPKGEPQPQAERRVFAWKHGQDKPINHADRRRGE